MNDVTILVRVLWPGGPQRIAVKEAELLRRNGFSVDLVFIRETSKKAEGVVNIKHRVLFGVESNKRLFNKVLQILTKHYNEGRGPEATVDLDLIGLYELTGSWSRVVIYFDQFTALFSTLRKVRGQFKKVVYVHETTFREKSPIKKLIERIALLGSDYLLTNSYFNREILQKRGYKNVAVLYPGVQLQSEFLSFEERLNICVVITVFEPWRRPEILIDIAQHLKEAKIIMAGQWADLKYKERITEEINRRNLNDRIEITGIIKEAVLQEMYKRSKVSLRLGFDEHGPGMGTLEAMGFGIPLIVNSGIGITEFLNIHNYDLIYENIVPNEIAESIDKLVSDKDYWERYHRKIIDIAKNISWERHETNLVGIIKKLTGETN